MTIDKVHFMKWSHDIVDVVCTVAGFHYLEVKFKIIGSAGRGFIKSPMA